MSEKRIDTLCVQAGYKPKNGYPRVMPIVQNTTYYYDTAEQLADIFNLTDPGYMYSRISNPTVSYFEEKLTALEKGICSVACSSGQSASLITLLNVCQAGDNVVCSSAIYGGTYNLFNSTLRRYNIDVRFIDPDSTEEEFDKLIDGKTKIIFGETIANPSIVVLDFEKIVRIARRHNILSVVDNTLATPALIRPAEYGINIIVHSTTKYLDGHAIALGGAIVDCGNFVFKGNPRYPDFNNPDESYHGMIYADTNAPFGIKARVQMMRDLGAIMTPHNAFLTNVGCETLALRMERHSENAKKVALYLQTEKNIEWVKYPSLPDFKYYDLAKKYLPNGCGGMLSFGIKGGRKAASEFIKNLQMIALVTHVADVRSCVLHPATTTHRQLSEKALEQAGISEGLVRLSVGIENADDIIADLKQALASIKG